ncbi:MAG: hypothetical protein LBF84_00490 [Holosporales bacterium]|nr:hypothetical protein [Holosporales bacterium]
MHNWAAGITFGKPDYVPAPWPQREFPFTATRINNFGPVRSIGCAPEKLDISALLYPYYTANSSFSLRELQKRISSIATFIKSLLPNWLTNSSRGTSLAGIPLYHHRLPQCANPNYFPLQGTISHGQQTCWFPAVIHLLSSYTPLLAQVCRVCPTIRTAIETLASHGVIKAEHTNTLAVALGLDIMDSACNKARLRAMGQSMMSLQQVEAPDLLYHLIDLVGDNYCSSASIDGGRPVGMNAKSPVVMLYGGILNTVDYTALDGYTLIATLNHHSHAKLFGHWTACVLNPNGQWEYRDDMATQQVQIIQDPFEAQYGNATLALLAKNECMAPS